MFKQIFVNLPVKDLSSSIEFWKNLGFEFDPRFTDEKAGSLKLGENIYAMLLTEEFFKTFVKSHEIADTSKSKEVLNALSVNSREEVDKMIEKVVEFGGKEYGNTEDYDWMYTRDFEDLDGHIWEVLYMDIDKFPGNKNEDDKN